MEHSLSEKLTVLISSGNFPPFMEFECSLMYSENSPFLFILHQTYPVNIFIHFPLRSLWILLCHQKWSHLQSDFLTTEYFNKIYVPIYYSQHGGCIIYVFHPTFLLLCLTKSTLKKYSICSFFQVRCWCLLLGSNNSTWHSDFKHSHTLFVLLTVRLPIPQSYKSVGKYVHIILVQSDKTSVNFLQM